MSSPKGPDPADTSKIRENTCPGPEDLWGAVASKRCLGVCVRKGWWKGMPVRRPRGFRVHGPRDHVLSSLTQQIPLYVVPGTVHPEPGKTRATLQEIPLYEVPGAVHP